MLLFFLEAINFVEPHHKTLKPIKFPTRGINGINLEMS